MVKNGRTSRQRHTRCKLKKPKDISYHEEYVDFTKWMKCNGYKKATKLVPAEFEGTGRGLMTKERISAGHTLISIPEQLLITSRSVLSSCLGPAIIKAKPKFTALQAICLYLVYEKDKGKDSFWFPYFHILPTSYTNALYWTSGEINLLPKQLQEKVTKQLLRAKSLFEKTASFIKEACPELKPCWDWAAFRWAWSTVNTRSIFMEYECDKPNVHLEQSEKDYYALAPYLDLLNHDPCAQIDAAFNRNSGCYEIMTRTPYQKYDQVFICYGPHENEKLMIEYGFITDTNPHNAINFTLENVLEAAGSVGIQMHPKCWQYMEKYNLTKGLTCSEDGFSWNLGLALNILPLQENIQERIRQMLTGDYPSLSDQEQAKVHQLMSSLISCNLQKLKECLKAIGQPKSYHEEMIHSVTAEKLQLLQMAM